MSNRPRLDFNAIKEAVPILKVAQMLNLDLKRDGTGFRCPCPIKNGGPRAIRITPDQGVFYCHGCSNGGDAIKLYAHIRACNNYDAADQIAKHFGIGVRIGTVPDGSPQRPLEGLKELDYLETDHPAIGILGLSSAACEAIGIGFAGKGTMGGRVVFPLRLPTGKLVGYFGLATRADQSPLLKFPGNLDEMCGTAPESKPEEPSKPEELRRLFRVVGH